MASLYNKVQWHMKAPLGMQQLGTSLQVFVQDLPHHMVSNVTMKQCPESTVASSASQWIACMKNQVTWLRDDCVHASARHWLGQVFQFALYLTHANAKADANIGRASRASLDRAIAYNPLRRDSREITPMVHACTCMWHVPSVKHSVGMAYAVPVRG